MSSGFNKSLIALSVTGLLASSAAHATNGYFAHGYSTKEKGLAGAGVAYSQDAMAVANNPAGIAFMGERLDVGAGLFAPMRSYTTTGSAPAPDGTPVGAFCDDPWPTNATGCTPPNVVQPPFTVGSGGQSIDSDNEMFLVPHFAYNWRLDSESALALGVYGNGGMNTEYKTSTGATATGLVPNASASDPGGRDAYVIGTTPGTFGAGEAGVDLSQLFFNLSYAKKIDANSSWGAGIIFAYQQFKATGLNGFGGFSLDPNNLSNASGHDTSSGFGAKLGYQTKVAPDVAFGVSYQTKMSMSEFDDYAGLFAEGGDFDIPATASIGIAWDIDNKSKLVVDLQQIYYSDVASIANSISQLTNGSCVDALNSVMNGGPQAASGVGCLGGSSGAGFGWDDMTILKVGYQWDMDDMIWRVGFSHGDAPMDSNEVLFNILAPAVIEQHITFGFTMPLGADAEFTFAGMYALANDVSGANPFDGGATNIEIEMDQYEFTGTYSMKF
ncbi:MAG: outer membrane protein transport protein [Gammaproteobacteria bacterium]|nr:outer membrane protein transport protein [Gammaproteobacteria bacterium]